jgi:hypothetical protein
MVSYRCIATPSMYNIQLINLLEMSGVFVDILVPGTNLVSVDLDFFDRYKRNVKKAWTDGI